jgi:DNA-binding transcriptional MerR regulator
MSGKSIEGRAFTTGQAAEIAGLVYGQLNHWAKVGFFRPTVADASGVDTCRLYSFGDVVGLATVRHLRDAGLGFDALGGVVEYLKNRDYSSKRRSSLLIGDRDGSVIEVDEKHALAVMRRAKTFCWILDIGNLIADVRSGVEKVAAPKRGKARCVAEYTRPARD